MAVENDILEPIKTYKDRLKMKHHENAERLYDEMVKKAGINKEENKATNDLRRKEVSKRQELEKKNHSTKVKKGLLIALAIILLTAGIALLALGIMKTLPLYVGIIGISVGVIAFILLLVLPIRKMSKSIKDVDGQIAERNAKIHELEQEGYAQLANLNAQFEWNMPASLVSQTLPLIQMDKVFDPSKFQYMKEKYGFEENEDEKVSTTYVQSGSILGNPFLIQRSFVTKMYMKKYVGTLVIHWTTTSTDSQGHTTTQHHTQTLTATLERPAPMYFNDTWLIYGNEAAPKLCFSRRPTISHDMDAKDIEKYVKSVDKKLDKLSEKAVKKGETFMRISNPEFEACFNALDRNNETEFRLLFTPLAQKNMVELIESKEPYGDDFAFIKRNCLNYIRSEHSQNTNLDGDPKRFYHYDLEESKNIFIDECDEYLKSFFFDMAPLLSIPLYQQHKDINYIYKNNYRGNVTGFETEVMANAYGRKNFSHKKSVTDSILKCEFVSKSGKSDLVNIHAYSYYTVPHVDFVPVMGGDGHMHNVPVNWDEYCDLEQITPFVVSDTKGDLDSYRSSVNKDGFEKIKSLFGSENGMIYQRGLISFIANGDAMKSFNSKQLDDIFGKK